jgi:fumarate hydratase class I
MTAAIHQSDVIESIADALQHISFYHPPDFVAALGAAYRREESAPARDAIAQILANSRMCAEGHRPICQDTGIVVVFLKIGMQVRWNATLTVEEMVNEGVRRAYLHSENPLRPSIVADPAGARRNTGNNSPAVVHTQLVQGDTVDIRIAAKGGGSENRARLAMLTPSDDVVEWVLQTVPTLGAGWCPPGLLGIGIGGSAEKAMLLAKEALMERIDIHELKARGPGSRLEEMRIELHDRINALGIGAQGLGGMTTVLDVKILDYPTHVASMPVGLIPNCAATRHAHFVLDGTGPVSLPTPRPEDWPPVEWAPSAAARTINLDGVTREDVRSWKPGETLLVSGTLLTGRDAAHKRIADLFAAGKDLPAGVDFANRFIYYVGPVDPVRDEVVGPAGPTTASRMDRFTEMMLEKTGLLGMIGKAERGPAAIEAIKRHKAVYLIAVGGAAYLVSKAIRSARVVAFPDLGMEAIYEFTVENMPVTVAVDSEGHALHDSGPALWHERIARLHLSRR